MQIIPTTNNQMASLVVIDIKHFKPSSNSYIKKNLVKDSSTRPTPNPTSNPEPPPSSNIHRATLAINTRIGSQFPRRFHAIKPRYHKARLALNFSEISPRTSQQPVESSQRLQLSS